MSHDKIISTFLIHRAQSSHVSTKMFGSVQFEHLNINPKICFVPTADSTLKCTWRLQSCIY